ncbi:MAG: diacylglycerol kinase family lipid kinase [Planctomycetia bacterium]|nr:MAG: diacylglycerol kinase family lipid kinase [Planctomycetia bacterium]
MNLTRPSVLILVNPKSGGGKARRLVPDVVRELDARGYAVGQFESRAAGDIARRVRATDAEYQALLVVGGDGTVREAIAGGAGVKVPLAVLPCGSANVLSTELALPRKAADVARLIDDGYSERLDSALLRHVDGGQQRASGQGEPAQFLLMVGAGIDGRVVHRVHERRRGGTLGKFKYVPAVVQEFLQFQPVRHWVTLEEGTRVGPFAQVLVTNVSSYGAFWKLPGNVDMKDGKLDVFGFRARGRMGMFAHTLRGSLNQLTVGKNLFHAQVSRVRVDAEQESLLQADGDPAGCCPVQIEARPASVRLLLPAGTRTVR